MKSAKKLFLSRGYHATSLKDIYNASNVSAAMINYHYHSKEKLLLALLLHAERPFSEVIRSYQGIMPSLSALHRFIVDTLQVMWSHKEDVILCLQEQIQASTVSSTGFSSKAAKAHYDQFVRLASFQNEIAEKQNDIVLLDLLYHSIFDMISGLFVARKTDCFSKSRDSQYSLDQIEEFITAKLLGVHKNFRNI